MSFKAMPVAFCSRVAFPIIYQSLFTYFLLLGTVGSDFRRGAIILPAVLGIPLTTKINTTLIRDEDRRSHPFQRTQAWFATLLVPLIQIALAIWLA